jgi:pimeloyl-ACP methyl ester carboxylesterase
MSAEAEPRQYYLATPGVPGWQRLAYVEWGDQDNPDVVVCVHGLSRNGRDFDVLARSLARRYRVICPDVIGRGLSDWLPNPADYSYPRYVADAALLIARLGVEKVHWVGTSMGGILGMVIAAMPGSPLRSLVLNDVGTRIPLESLQSIASYVGAPPSFDTLAGALQYLERIHAGFGLSATQWQSTAAHAARQDSDGRWRLRYDPGIGAAFRGPLAEVDLSAYWAATRLPTLILRGAESRLLTEAILAETLAVRPSAWSVSFAGCGHAPGLQDPAQIATIQDFLAGQSAAP